MSDAPYNGYVNEWELMTGGCGITEWVEYDTSGMSLAVGTADESANGDEAYDGGMILLPIAYRDVTSAGSVGGIASTRLSAPAPLVEIEPFTVTATLNADESITGTATVSGEISSAFLDTVPGTDKGVIDQFSVWVNGGVAPL